MMIFSLRNRDRSSLETINLKMPKKLQEDLLNPNLKWIIFINPPFATSNTVGMETGKTSKDTVSMTKIRELDGKGKDGGNKS